MKRKITASLLVFTMAVGMMSGIAFAAEDEVTVTYIDEESESEISYTYTSGEEITLPDNLFDTPDGYVFAGWIDSSSFLYEAGDTYTVTEDTSFWTWYNVSEDDEEDSSDSSDEYLETSGQLGDDVYWSYDVDTKTFTVSGSGDMYDEYWELSVGYGLWDYAEEVETIIIEDGITSISSGLFMNWDKVTSIYVPDSVTYIGAQAFWGCFGLEDEDGFLVINDILVAYDGDADEIVIPDGVKVISAKAIALSDATSAIIPASVESVYFSIFYFCEYLETITFEGDAPEILDLGYGIEEYYKNLSTVYYYSDTEGWTDEYKEMMLYYEGDFDFVEINRDGSVVTVSYDIIEAETTASYTLGSGSAAVIAVDADIDDFVSVAVDGTVLTQDTDYTVTEGSTIITFTEDYLESLEVGEYEVVVTFVDGTATGTLTILAAETSADADDDDSSSEAVQTGDNANLAIWFVLLAAAVVGCPAALASSKKRG